MNFLMRSTQHVQRVPAEQPTVYEPPPDTHPPPKPAAATTTTLEGLIAEDTYPHYSAIADHVGENESEVEHDVGAKTDSFVIAKHQDVSDEEGWIAIPYSKRFHYTELYTEIFCVAWTLMHAHKVSSNTQKKRKKKKKEKKEG